MKSQNIFLAVTSIFGTIFGQPAIIKNNLIKVELVQIDGRTFAYIPIVSWTKRGADKTFGTDKTLGQ